MLKEGLITFHYSNGGHSQEGVIDEEWIEREVLEVGWTLIAGEEIIGEREELERLWWLLESCCRLDSDPYTGERLEMRITRDDLRNKIAEKRNRDQGGLSGESIRDHALVHFQNNNAQITMIHLRKMGVNNEGAQVTAAYAWGGWGSKAQIAESLGSSESEVSAQIERAKETLIEKRYGEWMDGLTLIGSALVDLKGIGRGPRESSLRRIWDFLEARGIKTPKIERKALIQEIKKYAPPHSELIALHQLQREQIKQIAPQLEALKMNPLTAKMMAYYASGLLTLEEVGRICGITKEAVRSRFLTVMRKSIKSA
jgi:DNA-directed RNA polymerase specialized sigma24 family protein